MATTSMSDTEPARPRVHRSARRDVAHASSPIHVTIPDLASVAWISRISQRGLRLGSGLARPTRWRAAASLGPGACATSETTATRVSAQILSYSSVTTRDRVSSAVSVTCECRVCDRQLSTEPTQDCGLCPSARAESCVSHRSV